jgi:hypothetical protein
MIKKSIETTGIVEAQHRLVLDEPLAIMNKIQVCVIVLVTKEVGLRKVISPQSEDYVSKLVGLYKEIR